MNENKEISQKLSKETNTKEDDNMNATLVEKQEYKKVDIFSLKFHDEIMSFEEALKDETPIEWSEDVLSGKRKVIIKKQ